MELAEPVGLRLAGAADGLAGTADGLADSADGVAVELAMLGLTDVAGGLEGIASFEGAAEVQPAASAMTNTARMATRDRKIRDATITSSSGGRLERRSTQRGRIRLIRST